MLLVRRWLSFLRDPSPGRKENSYCLIEENEPARSRRVYVRSATQHVNNVQASRPPPPPPSSPPRYRSCYNRGIVQIDDLIDTIASYGNNVWRQTMMRRARQLSWNVQIIISGRIISISSRDVLTTKSFLVDITRCCYKWGMSQIFVIGPNYLSSCWAADSSLLSFCCLENSCTQKHIYVGAKNRVGGIALTGGCYVLSLVPYQAKRG